MAYTDAVNTTGALYYAYPEFIVYIGDTNGNPPDDPATGSPVALPGGHCTRVVQSAGGARLDFAELDIALAAHMQNLTQPADFTRMIDVRLPDASETLIFRGDYVTEVINISGEETLSASAQLRPYHFGEPVTGYDVSDPQEPGYSEDFISDDIVYNPTIDNETLFNRSNLIRTSDTGYLWTHPEIADTSTGEAYQGQTRNEWTLQQAVHSIIELLMPTQDFLFRPTSYAILSTAPDLRNVRIKLGTRLPEALDILLIPHGFNWYIDYDIVDPTLPTITIFKIGVGTEKELKYQAPAAKLDLEFSNTNRMNISHDISEAFNEVEALGEFEEAECTIPLYAGWPASKDSLTELAKDGADYPGNESVWRLFIANEAGDIDPAVSRLGQLPVVPDFEEFFTVSVPHRRNLGEPLTYQQDLTGLTTERPQRRPIVLEWSDDGGATWKLEENSWTVKLCPDQIGVYFDGYNIPTEIRDAAEAYGDLFRLQITGTIFSDYRITGHATKETWAVNGRTFKQVLAVPEKFQHRFRVGSGTFTSSLTAALADERDDTTEIQDYAEKIRDQNHYAEIDCEFGLPGMHLEYGIGDLITKIAGREISLDAAPATAPANRYMQSVERRYEMSNAGPSTVLIMDRGQPS